MTDFLLTAFIFLVAGVVSVPIASRFGLGSVLGYLIAGILISPVLGLLGVDVISIQHFAEFGVVMMLFLVGLELEPKKLWEMRAKLIGLGGAQVGLTATLVTAAALAFGQPWTISLAIGLVLALSSTAIVLQTLNEKGLMKSDGGQSSFSVLLFQDIAVIPMLALIPLLAMPELMDPHGALDTGHATTEIHATDDHSGEADHAEDDHGDDGHGDGGHGSGLSLVENLNGWQTALVTIAAIGVVIVGGSTLTGPIFRFIAVAKLRELFTATALMMVIGIALLMSLVGLSPALGTFLAGVVLANSEYRHELESDIDPFKGLLLGVFFITVGAGINFQLLSENAISIVGMTLGLIAIKIAVLLLLARIFKLGGSDKWLFGLGLAQAGEFGFVLLSFTVANQVIPASVSEQLLLVVALSMLLTPALFIIYDRVIVPKTARDQEQEADEIEPGGKIIIVGHGRVGGVINRLLQEEGHETTVIDFSAAQLEMLRKFGVKVYYGDGTRPDLLHSAGIQEAQLLIIAIDDKEQITELTRYACSNYPHLHVIARAVDRTHVYDLYSAGCRDIIRETYDSSIRMGRSVLEALGDDRARAQAKVDEYVEEDQQFLIKMASLYKPDVPLSENQEFVEGVKKLIAERDERVAAKLNRRKLETPDEDIVSNSAVEG